MNVPGHAAESVRFSTLAGLVGEAPLLLDVPPLLEAIDLGHTSPMDEALELAAQAWGTRRTWFLTNGASQGNRIATLVSRTLGDTTGRAGRRCAKTSWRGCACSSRSRIAWPA